MFGKSDVIPGRRLTLGITLTFVSLFLFIPLAVFILYASNMGFEKFFAAVTDWQNVHAYGVSFFCALTAGIISALFGLIIAWVLVCYDFRSKKIMDALIDLPFAISPVVAGLFFIMLFRRMSLLYPLLQEYNLAIVFAVPGIILATVFVTFLFITRELVPVMESLGRSEEEAAAAKKLPNVTILNHVNVADFLLDGDKVVGAAQINSHGEFYQKDYDNTTSERVFAVTSEKFFANDSEFTIDDIERIEKLSENLHAVDMYDLLKIFELRERLTVAKVLIEHLKARRETRWTGFAQNLDYPNRDDKFNLFVNSVTTGGKIKIIFRSLNDDLH